MLYVSDDATPMTFTERLHDDDEDDDDDDGSASQFATAWLHISLC